MAFEGGAGGGPEQPVGVGVAINVLYLSHTFLAQILCPLVFPPHISLLAQAPQLLPLFCAFYPTFTPAFSQTHFCGAAQEYKWSKMKKRGRQGRGEIDSEVVRLLTFNLHAGAKKSGWKRC